MPETDKLIREMRSDTEKLIREMRAETDKLMREMWNDLSAGLRRLESKMDRRFEESEHRIGLLEARVAKLEAEVAVVKRVMIENFERAHRNLELLLAEVRDPAQRARLDKIEERLARLEQHVGLGADE